MVIAAPLVLSTVVPPPITNVFAAFPSAAAALMFSVPPASVNVLPAAPNVFAPPSVTVPLPVFARLKFPEITELIPSAAPASVLKFPSAASTTLRFREPFWIARFPFAATKTRSAAAEPATVSAPPPSVSVRFAAPLLVMMSACVASRSFSVPSARFVFTVNVVCTYTEFVNVASQVGPGVPAAR